jgi:hypothetical protein
MRGRRKCESSERQLDLNTDAAAELGIDKVSQSPPPPPRHPALARFVLAQSKKGIGGADNDR